MAIISESIKILGTSEKEVIKEQFYFGLIQKNVLVTGANGQLGNELKVFSNKISSPLRFFFTDADDLDITCKNDLNEFVVNNNIQYIINCAAYTAVVKAENDIDKAFDVNVTGVENIALVAKQYGVKVIHVSTDYVFDGTSDIAYSEEMKTNPLSVYGSTKLKGEEALKLMGNDWIIIRTSWLFSEYGENFVKTMLRLMNEKESVTVVEDEKGSPTYAADLAEMLIHILLLSEKKDEWKKGVFHFCNSGEVTRFDFAKEIKRQAGLNRCELIPVTSLELNSTVSRPKYSTLDTSKITVAFGVEIPIWEDALERCLRRINLE